MAHKSMKKHAEKKHSSKKTGKTPPAQTKFSHAMTDTVVPEFGTPQTRGLIDGSLNNLHALDKSNVLGAMTQSKIDADGNNANTRG